MGLLKKRKEGEWKKYSVKVLLFEGKHTWNTMWCVPPSLFFRQADFQSALWPVSPRAVASMTLPPLSLLIHSRLIAKPA